jgi:hypothetical protein
MPIRNKTDEIHLLLGVFLYTIKVAFLTLLPSRMGLLFTQEIIFPNKDILAILSELEKDTLESNCTKASTKKRKSLPHTIFRKNVTAFLIFLQDFLLPLR